MTVRTLPRDPQGGGGDKEETQSILKYNWVWSDGASTGRPPNTIKKRAGGSRMSQMCPTQKRPSECARGVEPVRASWLSPLRSGLLPGPAARSAALTTAMTTTRRQTRMLDASHFVRTPSAVINCKSYSRLFRPHPQKAATVQIVPFHRRVREACDSTSSCTTNKAAA